MAWSVHDLDCPACGLVTDALVDQASVSGNTAICECGERADIVWTAGPSTIGIVSSGRNAPRVSKQAGRVFGSNREYRAFLKEGHREYVKGSADERKLSDRLQERAEKQARREGFRDDEAKNRYVKQEIAKGAKPAKPAQPKATP